MLVSHSCKFILFDDPMGACPWISQALAPWSDQQVAPTRATSGETTLFNGMSPLEAELAFDILGFEFRNYTRIAIVQNPFARLSRLYDRILQTDPIWQMRDRLGLGRPDYHNWLQNIRPDGVGAGTRIAPRWRRFGAWSAKFWCSDRITHVIRAEKASEDLAFVFGTIGIAPNFRGYAAKANEQPSLIRRPDRQTSRLVSKRYAWDLALYEPRKLISHSTAA